MDKGIFFRGGFDLEVYISTYLEYMSGRCDVLEDALYDFIYSQNFYFGTNLKLHKFV